MCNICFPVHFNYKLLKKLQEDSSKGWPGELIGLGLRFRAERLKFSDLGDMLSII